MVTGGIGIVPPHSVIYHRLANRERYGCFVFERIAALSGKRDV